MVWNVLLFFRNDGGTNIDCYSHYFCYAMWRVDVYILCLYGVLLNVFPYIASICAYLASYNYLYPSFCQPLWPASLEYSHYRLGWLGSFCNHNVFSRDSLMYRDISLSSCEGRLSPGSNSRSNLLTPLSCDAFFVLIGYLRCCICL